jgi:hypothetical protein
MKAQVTAVKLAQEQLESVEKNSKLPVRKNNTTI